MSDADPNSPHALARVAQARAIRARKRRVQRQVRQAQVREGEAAAPAALELSGKARSPTQRQGNRAEERALAHLQAAGLVLLARNLACRAGEIDLVCMDGQTLVFVEVRERQDERFGGAAGSIDVAKQQRLVKAARFWLPTLCERHFQGKAPVCRFDAVALEGTQVRWIRHAFVSE